MLPSPSTPSIDSPNHDRRLHRASQDTQSFVRSRNNPASRESATQHTLNDDRENDRESTSRTSAKDLTSLHEQAQSNRRGVLVGSNSSLMTPTGLVSTTATTRPSNWYELAVKSRAATLREAQRKMSTPPSLPTQSSAEAQTTSPKADESAPSQDVVTAASSTTVPEPVSAPAAEPTAKTEPITPTQTQPVQSAEVISPLAGGLVGASSSTASDDTSQKIAHVASSSQPQLIPALLASSTNRDQPLEGDELRTEVMGPPPTLPTDLAYPPLNPVASDAPVQAPNPKRRGTSSAASAASRKQAPTQAPADFVAPVNVNGKMPFALFQTVKKAPAELNKDLTNANRSQK